MAMPAKKDIKARADGDLEAELLEIRVPLHEAQRVVDQGQAQRGGEDGRREGRQILGEAARVGYERNDGVDERAQNHAPQNSFL
jgi:hypothetical protein